MNTEESSEREPLTARPTRPGDVVDAHVHLFTVGLLREHLEKAGIEGERFRKVLETRKFGRRGYELPDLDPTQAAALWASRLDDAGIAKALMVATSPDSEYVRAFLKASGGRVHALCSVDPFDPKSLELLEREVEAGFRGIKLYPASRAYRLSDPACRPFFDKAAELGVNFIIHYGVSVDSTSDMRFADPIDLSPVARDYPDTSFVIAHFGAGWLDSVLRLGYQCKNVCVDSSGTNNWMDYLPYETTLADVFRRVLVSLGPERILFGTDSTTAAPHYRVWIAWMQQRLLEEVLGLSAVDRDLILRGNAVRLFRLDDPLT